MTDDMIYMHWSRHICCDRRATIARSFQRCFVFGTVAPYYVFQFFCHFRAHGLLLQSKKKLKVTCVMITEQFIVIDKCRSMCDLNHQLTWSVDFFLECQQNSIIATMTATVNPHNTNTNTPPGHRMDFKYNYYVSCTF